MASLLEIHLLGNTHTQIISITMTDDLCPVSIWRHHLSRYGDSDDIYKPVVRPSYLYRGDSYTGKTVSLYEDGPAGPLRRQRISSPGGTKPVLPIPPSSCNVDNLTRDCSDPIANALELLQSCAKSSMCAPLEDWLASHCLSCHVGLTFSKYKRLTT